MFTCYSSVRKTTTIEFSDDELQMLINVIRGNCTPNDIKIWDDAFTEAFVNCNDTITEIKTGDRVN